MNCSVQRILQTPLGANALMFLLIFFTCNFTSDEGTSLQVICVRAVLLYVLLILLLKNDHRMLVVGFVILFTIYILNLQSKYYQAVIDASNGQDDLNELVIPGDYSQDKYEDRIETMNKIRDILEYVLMGSLLLGFVLYFRKQYVDHPKNFSVSKFFFGTGSCEHV